MDILLYASIVIFSVMQSASVKFYNRTKGDSIAFNVIKSCSALVFFAVLSIWGLDINAETALYGCLYGISLTVSMYSGYKALVSGPMALTSLIVSFSVIIPVIYGIGFCNEKMSLFKGLGFLFLVIAIISANVGKPKNPAEKASSGKWLLFVMITFVTNGICSVLQKLHQIKFPGEYSSEFMLFAMLTCSAAFVIISAFRLSVKSYKAVGGKKYAFIAGITNAIVNYLTIVLAGFESASVLFPTISVGTILGALLCGTVLFKEKMRVNHFVALAGGIAAVVFLKI